MSRRCWMRRHANARGADTLPTKGRVRCSRCEWEILMVVSYSIVLQPLFFLRAITGGLPGFRLGRESFMDACELYPNNSAMFRSLGGLPWLVKAFIACFVNHSFSFAACSLKFRFSPSSSCQGKMKNHWRYRDRSFSTSSPRLRMWEFSKRLFL